MSVTMSAHTIVRPAGLRRIFRLSGQRIPRARSVRLVGSFDDWDANAHPLVRGPDGWWSISLELAPGTYYYFFLVDGVPRSDPESDGGRVAEWGGDYSVRIVR